MIGRALVVWLLVPLATLIAPVLGFRPVTRP